MSAQSQAKPVTVQSVLNKKRQGEKILSLTCYDYSTARILDATETDILLVGDSLAMTVLGYPDTLSVTVDEMLHHVKAVTRGARRAMVVADMPFMSYHVDHAETIRNAGRFIQEGRADAVKLEGATPETLAMIRHLVRIGIPVMGHLGFTPQAIHTLGGYKVQGKTVESARQLLGDALALQEAGAFAVVLEMVPVEVAALVTRQLTVPTIGIGAGNVCDGQVLVIDDLLGRYADFSPRFVRVYLEGGRLTREAVQAYIADIRTGSFPDNDKEAFHFPESLPEDLLASASHAQ